MAYLGTFCNFLLSESVPLTCVISKKFGLYGLLRLSALICKLEHRADTKMVRAKVAGQTLARESLEADIFNRHLKFLIIFDCILHFS